MTLTLNVTDREGLHVGKVPVRVGLRTSYGKVSRFTDKTVWVVGRFSGTESMYRRSDGPLPSVPRGYAGKGFIPYVPPQKASVKASKPMDTVRAAEVALVSPLVVLKALQTLRAQFLEEGLVEPMSTAGINVSPAEAVTHLLAAPDFDKRLSLILERFVSPASKAT